MNSTQSCINIAPRYGVCQYCRYTCLSMYHSPVMYDNNAHRLYLLMYTLYIIAYCMPTITYYDIAQAYEFKKIEWNNTIHA